LALGLLSPCTLKKETVMYTKRSYMAAFLALLFVSMAGCSKQIVMNTDGMPISNHEYQLTNEETGIRTVFVLTRYYRDYEGKEYIVKPEFLDALRENRINVDDVERLGLHVKMVNIKKARYSLKWSVKGPKDVGVEGLLYHGKLSRRDFYLPMPFEKEGTYQFLFTVLDTEGNDLFSLPIMRYKVKGGEV
jgi:hypothetical protein